MADWYVSSAVYAGLTKWAATTAYTVGQLIKPLTTPAFGSEFVFRCTTAGTSAASEPSWPAGNNNTVTSNTAVFTNVSGQSAYGWSAAAGTLTCLLNRSNFIIAGERIFLSSDHADAWTSASNQGFTFSNGISATYGAVHCISVNRAGSVPPVAADELSGAAITFTASGASSLTIAANCNVFMQGVTITVAGSGLIGGGSLTLNNNTRKLFHLKNGALKLTAGSSASGGSSIFFGGGKIVLENCFVHLSNAVHYIASSAPVEFVWLNTASALQGTVPTTLFVNTTSSLLATIRGVDLSTLTTTLLNSTQGVGGQPLLHKFLLDSCKIAAGMTRHQVATNFTTHPGDEVELVNCWNGTAVINERYPVGGSVITDRAGYMSGGAADDIGPFSLKLVSNSYIDKQVLTLDCFPFDVEHAAVGSSKTATVEIIAGETLNSDDVSLLLQYMGTAGNPIASFNDTLAAALASSALSSSGATWVTPTFTPVSWNSIDSQNVTVSGGGLVITATAGSGIARATWGASTGKYYFEGAMNTWVGTNTSCGWSVEASSLSGNVNSASSCCMMVKDGTVYINGVTQGNLFAARSSGNILGVAADLTSRLLWYRIAPSGNWNGSGTANPATGVGGISISALTGKLFPYASAHVTSDQATANFGGSAFSGTLPSGFSSPPIPTTTKMKLETVFTAQRAGRVRGLVRFRKSVAEVWVNPQLTIL